MAAKQRSQDTVGAAPDLSLLELRRVPRVRIDQEIKTDAADRLLQNMLVHYSQPNGFMGRVFIERSYPHYSVELTPVWLGLSILMGLLAGVAGAAIPAWKAACQDPVTALNYE